MTKTITEVTNVDFIISLIDAAEMPKAEKAYLRRATETQGGIPVITGDRQYKVYAQLSAELRRDLPEHPSPEFSKALVLWSQSREGIHATEFVTKMMEWERRREVSTGQTTSRKPICGDAYGGLR